MSEQTRQLVLRLRQRLQAVIRRITFAEMAFGLVLLLGACSAYWVVSVALEAGFWLDVTPRAILFWGGVVLLGGLFVYFLLLPLLRLTGLLPGLSEEQVARRIGAHYPEVSDRLVNVLHLASGRHSDAPAPLVDGAVRMLTEQVQHVPFEQVERFERARRAARLATAPVLLLLVFLVAAPSTFVDASKRLLSPGVAFEKPAPFSFVVEPGSVELVRGASLEVVVHVRGSARPAQVHLVLNYPGEEAVQALPLTPDSTGAYRHTLVNVRRTLRYRAAAGHVESPWHTVTVAERPLVRGLQVQLDFPAYTRLPARRLDPNVGDVTALPGTEVSVEVGTGGEDVTEAFLRFDDGTLDTLSLDGAVAAGSFILHREGSYQVLLRNARGVENADPIAYQLRLLPDAEPTVVLLAPPPLADLNEQRQALLRLRIADDFGFTRLRLYYRLAESRFGQTGDAFHALELPRPGPHTLDQEIEYPWDLRATTGLDLVPGDVVEYYVAVWDNDTVAGYKSARTPSQRLRFPSLAEQYERLHEQENDIEETIETLREEADQVRRQFEELRDALRRKPEAGWEEQRQLEQLQERQQRLEQRVEELTSELDAATRQMEENNLVSEETLELFQELQEVAEEIRSPELMEALRQLQEAIQNMNLQQMQQALENFDFNEVQYRQRLERTLELFKQLRLQQELEEVARRAGELARQEERLAEETGKLLEAKEDRAAEDKRQADEARETNRPQETSREPQETGAERDTTGNAPENRDTRQEAKETGASPSRQEQLAREQERAREEMEALQERLKTLQEQMQEVKNAPKQEFQQLNQQLEQQDLPRQMQRNAEQLRQNQLQPARQGQQQMQQQLQQMQQQLQQMQQNMQGQQLQLNLAGLRRALSDILTLSQQQETLRGEVRGLAADSPLLRRYAQDQVVLSEGLSVVTDSLRSLARNIPQMTREVQRHAGEALREMGAATEAMAERVARRATGHQKGAMTHLNELALLLSDLLNQLMNSMSGMSSNMSMQQMIQQFQQMAQQQQQLNEQIQQLLNDMQGNRLVQDMQERLRQLAGQQEQIRNQLKQFSRNREFRNEILGDLNHIAEQMEETIRELQQQRVNRRTIERQQQILTRLLDATRSLQERGKEKRRESRTGEDVPRESPGTLTPREQAEKLRRDLLRALESGYAPDYEVLIKRYFELLQQMSRED